jgi:hypothetical protein
MLTFYLHRMICIVTSLRNHHVSHWNVRQNSKQITKHAQLGHVTFRMETAKSITNITLQIIKNNTLYISKKNMTDGTAYNWNDLIYKYTN